MTHLPHFLVIGAQRSGTTWLYFNLQSCPGIWLTPVKELHYFDDYDPAVATPSRRYRSHLLQRVRESLAVALSLVGLGPGRGRGYRFSPFWDVTYLSGRRGDAWYRRLFVGAARRGFITGEVSPSYALLDVSAIRKVHAVNPDMKIVFMVRDPVDRSWSQAVKLLCRDKGRTLRDVDENEFLTFFHSRRCSERADYAETLRRWEACFPREQIHVEFFDAIAPEPGRLLERVVSFLGADGLQESRIVHQEARNVAATGSASIPRRLRSELVEILTPHYDAMALRFPDEVRKWRARHLEALEHGS